MQKNQKGFTLIEMLVVIAVIGILSAVVLTSLGPSRQKAKDSRIISAMNQLRAIAEVLYDGDYDAFNESNSEVSNLKDEIEKDGGTSFDIELDSSTDSQKYAILVKLNRGKYYCVDSSGKVYEQDSISISNGECEVSSGPNPN